MAAHSGYRMQSPLCSLSQHWWCATQFLSGTNRHPNTNEPSGHVVSHSHSILPLDIHSVVCKFPPTPPRLDQPRMARPVHSRLSALGSLERIHDMPIQHELDLAGIRRLKRCWKYLQDGVLPSLDLLPHALPDLEDILISSLSAKDKPTVSKPNEYLWWVTIPAFPVADFFSIMSVASSWKNSTHSAFFPGVSEVV